MQRLQVINSHLQNFSLLKFSRVLHTDFTIRTELHNQQSYIRAEAKRHGGRYNIQNIK